MNRSRPAAAPRRPQLSLRTVSALALVIALGMPLAGCKTASQKADEYYQSGLQLLQAGDPDRAAVQFRNVFTIDGKHYEARKALAETLIRQGKMSEAYSQYLRLAEQYPDDLDTRLALARMAIKGGQGQEFDRHTTRALELAPADPRVKALDIARRYRTAVSDKDEAARTAVAAEADALLATQPDDTLLLSIALDQTARVHDNARAETLIDRLITLEPQDPLHYRQRLALLTEKGDMAAVEEHLRKTIAVFPDNAESQADLVRFYMSQNQPEKAEGFLRERAAAKPAEPGPLLDLIRFVEIQKGAAAARAELDAALAKGADPLVFGALRAAFDFRDGKKAEGVAAMQALLKDAPDNERTQDLRLQLARMLNDTGDEAGARAQVDKVLASNAAQPGALKMKAAWAIRSDDTDGAIAALRSVTDLNPRDAEALSLTADAYDRAGQPDLARDFLAQAAAASNNAPPETLRLANRLMAEKRYAPAEEALVRALKAAPSDVGLMVRLAQVYLAMPDRPRAEAVIAGLRDLKTPQATAAADRLQVQMLGTQGPKEALAYVEQLGAAQDASLAARYEVVRARLLTGDAAGALAAAQALVEAEPANRNVRMLLGLTQRANGDIDGARKTWTALANEAPADAQPWLMLSRLESEQGNADAARTTLDNGLKNAPDSPDLLLGKAGLLEQQGDIDGAIALYEQLYARNSDSVVIANNLASLLASYRSDNPDSLKRAQLVARRLQGTTVPAFMDTFGWIQHLSGDDAGALPYLQGAADGLPSDLGTQIHLGLVQSAVGQTQAARVQLSRAVAMAGSNDTVPVRAAKAELDKLGGPVPVPAADTAPPAAGAPAPAAPPAAGGAVPAAPVTAPAAAAPTASAPSTSLPAATPPAAPAPAASPAPVVPGAGATPAAPASATTAPQPKN